MTVRSLFSLAAAVSLGLASSAYAGQPTQTKAPAVSNQQLAEQVATRIAKSGVATGAKLSLNTQDGVVELSGEVRSAKQAEMIVQQVRSVPGVVKVETALYMATNADVQPVQAAEPAPMLSAPAFNPTPAPMNYPMMALPQAGPQDPIPLGAPGPNFDQTGPKLPPYSWPTYAPYNNFSRVAYPQAYPYNAFPFIGPYYPFPKVPLGWRSVKMEWDDGHWYLGRLSTPHDYWRVRFW